MLLLLLIDDHKGATIPELTKGIDFPDAGSRGR